MRKLNDWKNCCLIPKWRFRTIAKYTKPPHNEIAVSGSAALLGPVAKSLLLILRCLGPFSGPSNPPSCTQTVHTIAARNAPHYFRVARHPAAGGRERTISTATPRNDTGTSTGHFRTPNWTALSDALARRIASFDRRAIAAAKNLVNHVSLPSADRLLAAITSFETALTWPETQQRIQALHRRGLQRDGDFEHRWPAVLDTLLET